MADLTKSVQVIFSAVDNTSNALSSISGNAQKFSSSIGAATEPLAAMARSIELAETAIVALGVAFGVAAINNFKEFESASFDLKRQLDETDPSLEQFKQSAIDLSNEFGASSTAVLKGINDFKQAGFTAVESVELQRRALELMVAGDVDAAAATDILIKAIKGFGITVDEVPRFSEALNNVADKFAVNVAQLAEGTAKLSPIAKAMGFSFEETMGILTPVIEVFGSGSEAADAFKVSLGKLQDDAKPVRAALESIGVSQLDVNGKMRSGHDIFFDVANALQSVDANTRQVTIAQLVGQEQAGRMSLAFNKLAEIQEVVAVAYQKTGSVQRELATQMQSLEFLANQNAQAWHNLSIAVGQELAPGAKESEKAFYALGLALTSAVQDKSGGFRPILDAINAAEIGFAKFIEQIAKNLPEALSNVDFSGLVASFGNLGAQFGDIFSGIDLGTPQGLAKAIQFVVDSLESLTTVSAGVVNGLTPLGKTILGLLDAFNKLPDDVKFAGGSVIGFGQSVDGLKGFIGGTLASLKELGGILNNFGDLKLTASFVELAAAIVKINPGLASITNLLGPAGLVGAAGAAGYAIGTNLKGDVDELTSVFSGSKTTLGGWIYEVTHSGDEAAAAASKVTHFSGSFTEISKNTGVTVNSLYELRKAVADGLIVFDQATGQYVKAGTGIRDFDAEVKAASQGGFDFAKSVHAIGDALGLSEGKINSTIQSFGTLADAEKAAAEVNSQTTNSIIRYENGVYNLITSQKDLTEVSKEVTDSTKKIADETDKLTERQKIALTQTHELEMKLLELASNERIKSMEFTANIKVADIQADAQKVVAAFESISESVAATQAASAEIFASLTDAFGNDKIRGLDKEFLRDYAKRQQDQAQEALDMQQQLIDSQVRNMNARTDAMMRGQALIKINADDLAPELQLVLRSLLEHIQIEANQQGMELLV